MCEPTEVGGHALIYSGIALEEVKYASISLSFVNSIFNPLFIYLILNISLPGQLLSLLIMLQITFEWLKSLGEIIHFFCPVIKRTPELWFNILICHMWSSTFIYSLLGLFCKQNVVSMLIERCFYTLMPQRDLIYYPKTIIAYHGFTLLYLLAINMGITINVHVTPDGSCVLDIYGINPQSQNADFAFTLLTIILTILLPILIQLISFSIIFWRAYKHQNNRRLINSPSEHIHNSRQNNITIMIIIWSLMSMVLNCLDLFKTLLLLHQGYSYLTRLMIIVNDFLRSVEMLCHLFTLVTCVEFIKAKFLAMTSYLFRRN
ncbi:unnamed protein product [Heterobilharzia americana]|nr:unnamed protein product [Heterobilharzia americana]